MIDSTERAPQRILKRRDTLGAGDAARIAAAGSAPLAPLPGAEPAAPRSGAKSARVVPSEGGPTLLEVRCSCGEITHVEVQLGANAAEEVKR